jgi:hypothetical protein
VLQLSNSAQAPLGINVTCHMCCMYIVALPIIYISPSQLTTRVFTSPGLLRPPPDLRVSLSNSSWVSPPACRHQQNGGVYHATLCAPGILVCFAAIQPPAGRRDLIIM